RGGRRPSARAGGRADGELRARPRRRPGRRGLRPPPVYAHGAGGTGAGGTRGRGGPCRRRALRWGVVDDPFGRGAATPAGAGVAPGEGIALGEAAVWPNPTGGRAAVVFALGAPADVRGSSPLAWGEGGDVHVGVVRRRFIPTRVGRGAPGGKARPRRSVHPTRVGRGPDPRRARPHLPVHPHSRGERQ